MKNILLLIFSSFLLVQCGVSNNVALNHHLQKRKYTKGWHLHSLNKTKSTQNSESLEVKTESNFQNNTLVENQISLVTAVNRQHKVDRS